jgi:hypothetical protein
MLDRRLLTDRLLRTSFLGALSDSEAAALTQIAAQSTTLADPNATELSLQAAGDATAPNGGGGGLPRTSRL